MSACEEKSSNSLFQILKKLSILAGGCHMYACVAQLYSISLKAKTVFYLKVSWLKLCLNLPDNMVNYNEIELKLRRNAVLPFSGIIYQ